MDRMFSSEPLARIVRIGGDGETDDHQTDDEQDRKQDAGDRGSTRRRQRDRVRSISWLMVPPGITSPSAYDDTFC